MADNVLRTRYLLKVIRVVAVEPENDGELRTAQALQQRIADAWPDLGPDDSVRILVGLRAYREIDCIVSIELKEPRIVPSVKRRDGTDSGPALLMSAMLAIEIKQADASAFDFQGPLVFERAKKTSVNKQLEDEIIGLRTWRSRYGLEPFIIGGIAWLTSVPESELHDAEDRVVGANATWNEMLQAVGLQHPAFFGKKDDVYTRAIRIVTDKLSERRGCSERDLRRANALTNRALTDGVLDRAKAALQKQQITLRGPAGCGKSSALALLAQHASAVNGERVLILTYHLALCNELEALVREVCGATTLRSGRVTIAPLAEHIAGAYEWLLGPLPRAEGRLNYAELDRIIADAVATPEKRAHLAALAADLREAAPQAYEYDYVFIDEAQDAQDGERDFLRALHSNAKFVLGDGVDQLVRRGEPCDWNIDLRKADREVFELGRSLRMSPNVCAFVNEFAIASGATNWTIKPHPQALGGRVILCDAEALKERTILDNLLTHLSSQHATPSDLLVCVWHGVVERPARESHIARDLRAWGYDVWDGVNPIVRATPADDDAIRIVQYESARGLEGWCTVLIELDEFYQHRLEHPNVDGSETDRERERLARLWVLMALARAAHTLVISVKDWNSTIGRWLLEAARQLPAGLVERRESAADSVACQPR